MGIKGLLGFCPYHLVVFLKGLGHELNCLFFNCLVFIVLEKLFFNNHKELSVSRVSCGGLSKMEGLQFFFFGAKKKQLMLWLCLHIE